MKRRTILKSTLGAPLVLHSQRARSQTPKRAIQVAVADDRFHEHLKLGGTSPTFCKVSAKDTNGGMCIFEEGRVGKGGPPLHLHHDQEEWFYIMEGEYLFQVGDEKFRLKAGECVLAPRQVPHTFAHLGDGVGKMMIVFQPAGDMEAFFREFARLPGTPSPQEAQALFRAHGMEIAGPRLPVD
jgi:mannose-6-phosphate isomerase-like protein (cupin superfamily)